MYMYIIYFYLLFFVDDVFIQGGVRSTVHMYDFHFLYYILLFNFETKGSKIMLVWKKLGTKQI